MANPFRGEMKSTGAAKGRAMGVQNDFMPERASRISWSPNSKTAPPAPDLHKNQVLGDPTTTQPGAGYENDASGWVRGVGESGEGKPGFDHSKKSG